METPETSITTIEAATEAQTWSAILNPWWKAGLAVLPLFVITRILFLLLTHLAGVLLAIPNNSSTVLTANAVLYSWYHWDAPNYLTIAATGYIDTSYTSFFPLYPAIVHGLSTASHMDILLTGLLISNLALLGALIVLYRFVEQEWDREAAQRSILYITIFPTALILFDAYNTSLLLFFIVLCLYYLRKGEWLMAGCYGGLAALTDLFGLLLIIVFYCEWYRQYRQMAFAQKSSNEDTMSENIQRTDNTQRYQTAWLVAGMLIPLGTGIYAYVLGRQIHDPWAFLKPQGNWMLEAPWKSLYASLHIILKESPYTFAWTHSIFELLMLVLCAALLLWGWWGIEKLERQYWPLLLFGLLGIIYTLLLPNQSNLPANPLDPIPNIQVMVLVNIPVFVILARLGKRAWFHHSYLLFALPFLTFFIVELFKGGWVM